MRKHKILIVMLLVVGLAVAAASYYGAQFYRQANASQNALEASYQNNFFNLIENMENLDVLLGKTLASNSAERDTITLASVWSMAEMSKTNLSNLPFGTVNTERSNQYLSQLGDFCYSLAQKTANGQKITDTDWQKISQLQKENRAIHNELRDLLGLMQEKQVRFGSLTNADKAKLPQESQSVLEDFGKLDERLQDEVPTLTYDGPFSDHVVNRQPRGLDGEIIDQKQAENIALQFVKKIGSSDYTVSSSSLANGRLPSYSIILKPENTGKSDLILGISRQGGHVVLMMDGGGPATARKIGLEQAIRTAREFMKQLELGDFVPTGHLAEGNELLVNFAPLQNEVVIYPDMIQVSVSLSSGNVVAYDASKYLMSHMARKLATPEITAAQARSQVNPRLDITRVRLALIPLGNLEELLTYEVKGTLDSDTYYVYINALTGTQEKILLIVETPDGSRSI